MDLTTDIAPIKGRWRFTEQDKIVIDDVEYEWDYESDEGIVFVEVARRHRSKTIMYDEIEPRLKNGSFKFETGYHAHRASELRAKIGNRMLHQIKEPKLKKAFWRQTWCDLYLEVKGRQKVRLANGALQPLMKTIADEYFKRNKASVEATGGRLQVTNREEYELQIPSPKTLKTWVNEYVASGCNIAVLIDSHSGNPGSDFTDEERSIHARYILRYASRTKPSIAHLHRLMSATIRRLNRSRSKDHQIRSISESWLRYKINELPDFFKMAGREGERRARIYYQAVSKGAPKRVAMQRLEADEWRQDIRSLLIDAGIWYELSPKERAAYESVRLWFSGIIDTTTRCIVSLRIFEEDPSIASAFETLAMTALDKTNIAVAAGCRYPWEMRGGFRSIGVDSATWYVSPSYRASLNDLGAAAIYPPSGEPYLRGTIERFFRTISQLGLQDFSGKTFSNVVEKGDNDPESEATVRKDLLIKVFIRLVVDIYHNTPHAGLGGTTPRQAWRGLNRTHWPAPPKLGSEGRHVFGVPHRGKVTKYGIVFHGIQYQSPVLQRMRMNDVDVEVDFRVSPNDISAISVSNGETYLEAFATISGLENISLFRWLAACEQLRVYDREQLELDREELDDALLWASEQADVARAELGLGTPTLDLDRYEYLMKKQNRFMTVKGKAVRNTTITERAKTSPELSRLFGFTSKLKPKEQAKVVQSNGAESRRKPVAVPASATAGSVPADANPFAARKKKED